jgi:hypothetical protein
VHKGKKYALTIAKNQNMALKHVRGTCNESNACKHAIKTCMALNVGMRIRCKKGI